MLQLLHDWLVRKFSVAKKVMVSAVFNEKQSFQSILTNLFKLKIFVGHTDGCLAKQFTSIRIAKAILWEWGEVRYTVD